MEIHLTHAWDPASVSSGGVWIEIPEFCLEHGKGRILKNDVRALVPSVQMTSQPLTMHSTRTWSNL